MNLVTGKCLICKQKEQVLKTTEVRPFFKYIFNTYFLNNKIGIKELKCRVHPNSLCVVCACNVETSYKFKKTYENKSSKKSKKTLTCCFMCDFRGFGLVKTQDNPNQFEENVSLFMKTISRVRPYEQCAVCFVCVLELQNFSKIHAALKEELEKTTNKIEEITISEDEDLKIIPFRESIAKQHSTPKKPFLRNKRKKSDTTSIEDARSSKIPKIYLSKECINNSSVVQSVKTLSKIGRIKLPEPAILDKKMYFNLPFIGIERTKSDIINNTDTTAKCSANELVDSVNNSKPKVPIKIKLLSKKRSSKPCPNSKKKLNKCEDCNYVFPTFCELKSHLLWHEKPGSFKVEIIRDQHISKIIGENQKLMMKDLEEQKQETSAEGETKPYKALEEAQEINNSQKLIKILDNVVIMDTTCLSEVEEVTKIDNLQKELNKHENKELKENTSTSNEKVDQESDKTNAPSDESVDKDEYVVLDEVVDDSDNNDGEGKEEENYKRNHTYEQDMTELITSQQDQMRNESVVDVVKDNEENGRLNGKVEENNEEKEKQNGKVESHEEDRENANKKDENNQKDSEETNEEYHDADDEINLSLSESDKCSEKSKHSKDSSESDKSVNLEESEEQTKKDESGQDKLPEVISDDDPDQSIDLESNIERKLRIILGEGDDKVTLKNKEDIWDEACSEKKIFDLSKLNNTILKKKANKSTDESSPKTPKKVRFVVENSDTEEETVKSQNSEVANESETVFSDEDTFN